ncbi:hypothetical protein OG863_27835 [Streptomyces decoyicus]|uniref:Uncharacterized protein n=1 Tax=Streptomyces decoyicus TaxID=249567 RepID=A0ABZ1FM24_9ACTN|nr:WD40 repeat domain-containing protein [Streptomyces decoyicus]WSB71446.1 hypothetical protein OG863_27835 [Streptomyces decoyicus]
MTTASPPSSPDIAAWPPLEPHREDAGRALFDWVVTADDSLPPLCLLRGGRASGKSHLLAWFLAGSASHARTMVHVTVPAAGLITEALAWRMSRQLGYGPLTPHRLLDRIAADHRPMLVVVPDLHLAGRGPSSEPSAQPQTIVDELLAPLLQFPHVRAIVETGSTDLLDTANSHVIDLGEAPHRGAVSEDAFKADFSSLLADVARTPDGRLLWNQAPPQTREHVLDAALDEVDDDTAVRTLLADPGFLVHGSATAITATLNSPAVVTPAGLRRIWDRAAPQLSSKEHSDTERAALLHAAALSTSPTLSEYLRPLAEQHHWTAMWAQHDAPTATQCLMEADDQLIVADALGRLHLHRLTTGNRTGMVSSPAAIRSSAIAAAGPDALLLLDETGPLHPLTSDEEGAAATVLGHIASHHDQTLLISDASRTTALGSCPQSSLAVVGDATGAVHLWSLAEYRPMPQSCRLHTAPVTAVTCLRLPEEDLSFVVSAAFDGSIRLWETSQEPMEEPVDQRPALVTALAAAETSVGLMLAAAWNDAELHLWHLTSGRLQTLPLLYRCNALTLSSTGQLTIGGPDGLHGIRLDLDRLWD